MSRGASRRTGAATLVIRLLEEVLPPSKGGRSVAESTSLGDLGLDSLGRVAFAYRLYEETGVEVNGMSEAFAKLASVGELEQFVTAALENDGG